MDIITTSLDALLHKATNTNSLDAAAVEAFCALINREKEGPYIGAKLLAAMIHSKNETEALHALTVLDVSMKKCNNAFHSEIGKFRFLNEMIKLVSPKYLGSQTPVAIKQEVLQLLYIWTLDYPKETKIKEAYDMLKKQGVIREVPLSVSADSANVPERQLSNSIFQDEEKNKLLQKLLQSKNPEDLQAANRLIKNMVKEDDKRAELKSRRVTELESVHNNVRLLSEMLDSYKPDVSSQDELELIKELHESCERLRPNVFKLIAETQQNEEMLNEVLHASDELGQVFDKFTEIIIKGNIFEENAQKSVGLSLLDLGSPNEELQGLPVDNSAVSGTINETQSDMDLLCKVFSTNVPNDEVLKPISTRKECKGIIRSVRVVDIYKCALEGGEENASKMNKLNALDDLDALGEHLLKENLSSKRLGLQFNKTEKIPMNLLVKQSEIDMKSTKAEEKTENTLSDAFNLDLSYLLHKRNKNINKSDLSSNDDLLVDITEEKQSDLVNLTCLKEEKDCTAKPSISKECTPVNKPEIKLNDLTVKLEDVKPSSVPPLVVLQEKNGITVTLHFGKNKPRDDVRVVVVTTISKNELPLSNFLFQAVVPKVCKLKLQPASSTELPAYNPFLPPSAITQVMLIANPQKVNLSLKFIISYIMDDETITEMGEVDCVPFEYD